MLAAGVCHHDRRWSNNGLSCRGRRQATAAASHRVKADASVVQWIYRTSMLMAGIHFSAIDAHSARSQARSFGSLGAWRLALGSWLPGSRSARSGGFYPQILATHAWHSMGSGAGRERPSFSHERGPSTIDVFRPPGQSIPANPATSALVHCCVAAGHSVLSMTCRAK